MVVTNRHWKNWENSRTVVRTGITMVAAGLLYKFITLKAPCRLEYGQRQGRTWVSYVCSPVYSR